MCPLCDGEAASGDPILVILGPPGSGKTTVGSLISQRIGRPLVEADDLVETIAGESFEHMVIHGRVDADDLRERASLEALGTAGSVVTLGPSSPMNPRVFTRLEDLRDAGRAIIHLTAGIAEVARRTGLNAPRSVGLGAPRAVLTQMMRQAEAVYGRVSILSVDTRGISPEEVAEGIVSACKLAEVCQSPRNEEEYGNNK